MSDVTRRFRYARTLSLALLAVAAVFAGGVWSSVWTWRHRTARAHVLSLLLILWGMVLGATELLPRLGYAKADPARPTGWTCSAANAPRPAAPAPSTAAPVTTPAAPH